MENQLRALKEEFLDKRSYPKGAGEVEYREELQRRLHDLSKVASDMTDVNSVTGEYQRKINWKD